MNGNQVETTTFGDGTMITGINSGFSPNNPTLMLGKGFKARKTRAIETLSKLTGPLRTHRRRD